MTAAELFSQLFPGSVQMTGELLADLGTMGTTDQQTRRRGQGYDTVRLRLSQAARGPGCNGAELDASELSVIGPPPSQPRFTV